MLAAKFITGWYLATATWPLTWLSIFLMFSLHHIYLRNSIVKNGETLSAGRHCGPGYVYALCVARHRGQVIFPYLEGTLPAPRAQIA